MFNTQFFQFVRMANVMDDVIKHGTITRFRVRKGLRLEVRAGHRVCMCV